MSQCHVCGFVTPDPEPVARVTREQIVKTFTDWYRGTRPSIEDAADAVLALFAAQPVATEEVDSGAARERRGVPITRQNTADVPEVRREVGAGGGAARPPESTQPPPVAQDDAALTARATAWCSGRFPDAETSVLATASLAALLAQVRAEALGELAAWLKDAEIDAEGLDICTWGEGVGEGVGSCREAVLAKIEELRRPR